MLARYLLIELMLLTLSFSAAANPFDFYVSPAGNDAWSGRRLEPTADGTDGPVATLARARDLVRELRQVQPKLDRPVTVAIRGGTYYLKQPLTFTPQDSGTAASPSVYQAYEAEHPVLSGGTPIAQWQVNAEGRWQTTLEDVRSGKWQFSQLFVNDQRRQRPRLPKQGYFHIAAHVDRSQFDFAGDDIRADWSNLGDVEVLVFHEWSASRLRIASVRPAQHRVVLSGEGWQPFETGHRYIVDNVPALSEPGQWYLDRPSGQLTYIPKAGERPNEALVVAPRLEHLLEIQGDLAGKRWVEDIQFRGLSFAHSNWVLPATGQSFPQAEIGLDAAIVVIGGRSILFDQCVVRHVGGYGIAFGAGSRDNRLENCELVDLGGGGVKIGHAGAGTWDEVAKVPDDPELLVSRHTIKNCLIAHGGRLHPAGLGIWVGNSSFNSIQNNDVFDFYQTGISVGWTWGYGPSNAHDNDVGFNHVHMIGQGVTSDMGGIYTLGVQPGTVVHDNRVHDIKPADYGGWGLYADEGSSDIVMERNVVYRAQSAGFYQHFGKENRVWNNVFAFSEQNQIGAPNLELHTAFDFERNIVYWDNLSLAVGGCFNSSAKCVTNFNMDHNIYWNAAGLPPLFPGSISMEKWREERGQDKNSVVADPMFVDTAADDFRLRPSSPAMALGFQPFDTTAAGRTAPVTLTKDLPSVPAAFQ